MPEQLAGKPSRRAALGLTVVGAAVSGCSVEVRNPFAGSGASATPRPGHSTPDADPDHDLDIATQALGLVESTLDLVVRTGRRHPALRHDYAGLRRMHRAHADALADAVPAGQGPPAAPHRTRVPHDRPRAQRAVSAAESALRTQLAALAQRAASGQFARLLAAMAAAVAQREDR